MSEVKWIKITTDIFDDEKILLIEGLPEADSIIVIWFKLLCLAGKTNNSGVLMMNDKVAYTDKMLATIFRRKESTVTLALQTFEKFGMIELVDDVITIPNWGKHQNIEGMEKVREQTRLRVAKYRENQKKLANIETCQYCGSIATGVDHILAITKGGDDSEDNKVPCCIECNRIKNDKPVVDFLNANRDRINDDLVTNNEKLKKFVTLHNATNRYIVTESNAIEKEEDREIEKEREEIYTSKTEHKSLVKQSKKDYTNDFLKLYNDLCPSLPKVRTLSDKRKSLINKLYKNHSKAEIQECLEKCEASDFLAGYSSDWRANLDWIIEDKNFCKILDGNYDNHKATNKKKSSIESRYGNHLAKGKYDTSNVISGE